MKSAKQEVLEFVSRLPDDASIEDTVAGIYVLLKLDGAVAELDRGEGIPNSVVMESLDRWVASHGRPAPHATSNA